MELRIYKDAQGQRPLIDWLDGLKDVQAKAKIRVRLTRLSAGNFGDCKPVRDGVQD